ncbi:hypothetical protein FHX42_005176 [Saccharopolyspora lacisalsi]|uniref:Uncharacterized protein n=1 Tax=Halosaccharopolyspora lacisalsi TaxID=1000566 RepID=A0A839E4J1_9PSEU|nr:hypothetical protein [Halosaccharopolyspora lacisalsi]
MAASSSEKRRRHELCAGDCASTVAEEYLDGACVVERGTASDGSIPLGPAAARLAERHAQHYGIPVAHYLERKVERSRSSASYQPDGYEQGHPLSNYR